ncbi:unnamed protein product [Adineta ricciae]|uniref:Uncharacterized protein n=1 Tax=Adineta ricciae TaxID=249248 RepID=A0A814LVI8_ADIRI|nr:unnamed protein product [Adineta ricciae]CAF1071434.1 unnamed protein product [Adineta ricciae]
MDDFEDIDEAFKRNSTHIVVFIRMKSSPHYLDHHSMHSTSDLIDIPRKIKSHTGTAFAINCTLCLFASIIIGVQNLIHSKVNSVQFTNVIDVRIINSITEPNAESFSSRCAAEGCLQILGQILFPLACWPACRSHKLEKLQNLNFLQTPMSINLTSTLNENHMIEFDTFNIVVLKNQSIGEQIEMFFLYNFLENQNRTFRLNNVPLDASSLTNITHLVSDAISQSHADILDFTVIQADIVEASATLNVTVLISLKPQCLSDCQRLQINKLTILPETTICASITLTYDGNTYDYNASLTGVYLGASGALSTRTTQSTTKGKKNLKRDLTFVKKIYSFINKKASIFEISYQLNASKFIVDKYFEGGTIVNSSTLNGLSIMMQTTLSNDSNINVTVFNASITDNNGNTSLTAHTYIYTLRLIVYYLYPVTCYTCAQSSNDAVRKTPVFVKTIRVRNGTLISISHPHSILTISPANNTTTIPSPPHHTTEHTSTKHHPITH